MTDCREQRLVDRHFAGTLGSAGERALRDHLPGCAACRDRYERHLVLDALDPARPDRMVRLGRAIGLEPMRPRRFAAPALAAAFAAAAVLLVISIRPRVDSPDGEAPGIHAPGNQRPGAVPPGAAARGTADRASRVFAYRIGSDDEARPVDRVILRSDELAFAYENPAGWHYLLVFAVDERGRVYWYHPTWQDAADNPRAIAIEPGATRRELSAATRHDLDAAQLRLYFVFTEAALSVRDVESVIAAAPPLAASLAVPQPSAQSSLLVEVQR
jgi:hypothetical protein